MARKPISEDLFETEEFADYSQPMEKATSAEKTVLVNIRVPESLRLKVRKYALEKNVTVTDIVNQYFEELTAE